MANDTRVFSFSVKSRDVDKIKEIEKIKIECSKQGISFSHVVLRGLELYQKDQVQNIEAK